MLGPFQTFRQGSIFSGHKPSPKRYICSGDNPVKISLLGVRGSTPVSGAEYVRYGGNTSCVAVTGSGDDAPSLVLDAGTGLRTLSRLLPGPAFRGAILLSHLHWDHMQGLPFFTAGDHDESAVQLFIPDQDGRSGRDLLARMMSPPSFPITPECLRGSWEFNTLEPGRVRVAGFDVTAAEVAHKGGRTFGFRIEEPGGASIGYLPDHGPVRDSGAEVMAMLRGVDLLIHDAQFLERERAVADKFGHATVADALAVASEAGVGELLLFHHGPARTDDELDAIAAQLRAPMPVSLAAEGRSMTVGAASPRSSE